MPNISFFEMWESQTPTIGKEDCHPEAQPKDLRLHFGPLSIRTTTGAPHLVLEMWESTSPSRPPSTPHEHNETTATSVARFRALDLRWDV
jgi:hypothetical protein